MSLKSELDPYFTADELSTERTDVKFVSNGEIDFPVMYCQNRENRPYKNYSALSREDCPLCTQAVNGKTSPDIIQGWDWLPATWPIKTRHGICYPHGHRSGITAADIRNLGSFADKAGDVMSGINMFGSAASIPAHFHAQVHDYELPLSDKPAFPLLSRQAEPIYELPDISLSRIAGYPAFVLLVKSTWDLLGKWLIAYLASANTRPHSFALVPGGKLYVIPRSREIAPGQENKFGASEMLGLITPITFKAYQAINDGNVISDALRACGMEDRKDIMATEEHAAWTMNYIMGVYER